MFVENIQGIMMDISSKEGAGYEYEIWFPYTKKSINTIRDGTLLAVKNFACTDDAECLSVLQVTSVLPMHYALGNDRTGYPGFVEEAAVSAAQDWQQETPTEETTKIVCKAIPSYVEIRTPSVLQGKMSDPSIGTESNIPMIGERVRMLNSEWMEKLVNRGLSNLPDRTLTLGHLSSSPSVNILVLWEELVQTHFGIFAYTKAGKSNLVSTCISKMLGKAPNVKIVVLDIMSEYSALLIDALCNTKDACIVCCRPEAMPNSVISYWANPDDKNLTQAATDIVNTTLLPKNLKPHQKLLIEPIKYLLSQKKVRLLLESRSIGRVIEEAKGEVTAGVSGTLKFKYLDFVDSLMQKNIDTHLGLKDIEQAISDVDTWIQDQGSAKGGSPSGRASGDGASVTATIRASAERLKGILEKSKSGIAAQSSIKSEFTIRLNEMISALNREDGSSLFVVQSNRDEDLRGLVFSLGNIMLDVRRESGQISPLVSFVFDEADMFIPSGDSKDEDIGKSRSIARQLARRGRKYGLGIGIATQRIVYLDTHVLGQPHTYFISKLPRQMDRQRIQEAFGISEESMRQTLRFEKGQWLLVSDDATGMEGVPIPITVPDANNRITDFLEKFKE